MKKVKENIIMIVQTIVLISAFLLPFFIDIQDMFQKYIEESYLAPDNFWIYFALTHGNFTLAVFLFIAVFFIIRQHNKEVLMMNRDNSLYHNYPYLWYVYCAKILGIKRCNLINVPIFIQMKLVIHQTFDDYPLDDNDYPLDENNRIFVEKTNEENKELICNLILEDTYPVSVGQIPNELYGLYTIKISRNNGSDVARYYSEAFVTQIINEVRRLPNGIKINIFATTNPKNTLNIARKVFGLSDRSNVSEVYVFQQEKEGKRVFKGKGKKIL